MAEIAPLEIDLDTTDMLRTMQDLSDAIAYAFVVPNLCARPMAAPGFVGIDWAKGYGVNIDEMEGG